jgi:hypothetical protein
MLPDGEIIDWDEESTEPKEWDVRLTFQCPRCICSSSWKLKIHAEIEDPDPDCPSHRENLRDWHGETRMQAEMDDRACSDS